jgi:uncharacterized repeat protein (TIGR03803 family)
MRRVILLCGIAGLALLSLSPAQATFATLYSFRGGNDGSGPISAPIGDPDGNLYGTTIFGGTHGLGVVFELAPDGTETVLHAFKGGKDGAYPRAKLTRRKDGTLYGTTTRGGGGGCGSDGCGTVFSIAPDGTETVLYAFTGSPGDGANPFWGVIQDSAGNLYGTTSSGADGGCQADTGCGVLFKLTPGGNEKPLYTFQGSSDGGNPNSNLIRDESGNLFGAALSGGNKGDDGAIFKFNPGSGEIVLQKFSSKAFSPAGLSMDRAGNLYTTLQGGLLGHGAVFRLAPDGSGGLVYSFRGGRDGDAALSGVIVDAAQNLYGTTLFGGGKDCGGSGCGVVFRIAPNGTETILHSFKGSDGAVPAGLLRNRKGSLYGTTFEGGANGFGTVYKIFQ